MKYKYLLYIFIFIIILLLFYLFKKNSIDNFKNEEPLKVAVFFSGRIKDYELELNHLINLQQNSNATFFASINEETQLEYMTNFFKVFNMKDEQKNIQITPEPKHLSGICNEHPTGNYLNIYSMYFHNNKCYELIDKYQKKNNILFDIILKYRVDIDYSDRLILDKPADNTIYIPEEYDWGGINDQIAYGNNESMKLYCSIIFLLPLLCSNGTTFHPELLLKDGLTKLKLNVIRFNYKYTLYKNKDKIEEVIIEN